VPVEGGDEVDGAARIQGAVLGDRVGEGGAWGGANIGGAHTVTAADPLPVDLRAALDQIHGRSAAHQIVRFGSGRVRRTARRSSRPAC
jgi:hypothetical protein